MSDKPSEIVGHKTFSTGEINAETGFPFHPLRHVSMAMWKLAEHQQSERAKLMPDEQAAIRQMFNAWYRLKELGWNDIAYCPKDGSRFRVIENGSTGIFDCTYNGTWPDGYWTTFDEHDSYPSSISPALYRLYPEDEVKRKQRMAEASARFKAEMKSDEA